MPTIADAVKNNQNFRAQFGELLPVPVTADAFNLGGGVSGGGALNLPIRGTLPANFVDGVNFYNTTLIGRNGRSSVSLPPVIEQQTQPRPSKPASPETLSNKNLQKTRIGNGTVLNRYNRIAANLIFSSVGSNSQATQTFSISGVQSSDIISGFQWSKKQTSPVVILGMRVVGTNSVAVDLANNTVAPATPTGGSVILFLFQ